MIKCKFEDGGIGDLRHVTVDALVIKGNEILLVKRSEDSVLGAGKYVMPGGYLDRDETTEEGILREVKEETGYEAKIKSLFLVNDSPGREGEDRQNVTFVYIVEPIEKTGEPDSEIDGTRWVKLGEIKNKDDFAFDHYTTIELYKKYLKDKFDLPLIGKK